MNGIRNAGEYILTELKLFTSTGEVINLNSNYTLLDIYENMFSNGLTGTVTIKIMTPGLDNIPIDFTKHVMAVYKIDLRKSSRGNEVFQLHFCSPELLRNNRVRLSKSYDGNISDIVNIIL